MICAAAKTNSETTPEQLQRQGYELSRYFHAPVVFIFDRLATWQRKRLIEKKIGFAEPFRQLYIPELLLQLNDPLKKETRFEPTTETLKPPAQCLLLFHLQIGSLEQMQFHRIAETLNYSPMTVSRAVKELEGFNLLKVEGSKEKWLRFERQGKPLWEKALPHLSSPVRDSWLAEKLDTNEYFRVAGDNALAAYTMLAETEIKTWAIGKDAFRIFKNDLAYKNPEKNYGDYKLEVWHYDPALLSQSGEVDKLSLYLSMRHEEDERVQGALTELINNMQWL